MRAAWAPGLLLAIAVAIVATVLGVRVPVAGAPVFAIVLGIALTFVLRSKETLAPGIRLASKQILQWSIVLLGAHLSLVQVVHGGLASLPVMLVTFAIVLTAGVLLGRMLGLPRDVRRLLSVGTAICGGSAIAAVSGIIEAEAADVAYALAAVFSLNVVAVLLFPPLGQVMHLSQSAFGLWAGTAINDTSSVVAAGYSYGHAAGNDAVIVKLTRVLLIVPVVLWYALRSRKRDTPIVSIVPWFVVWFLVAAALNSLGLIPAALTPWITNTGLFAITVALAAVGLSTDAKRIAAAGWRPLALGALLWVLISVSSLVLAHALHYA